MQIIKLLKQIEVLPNGGTALDVGPKHFQDTFSLIKAGFRVTAIEPNEEDIVKAYESNGNKWPDNLQVVNLKLEDSILEHYDVIIAGNVLPFTDDPEAQLERLFKSLNKGGVISFNLWGPEHAWAKDFPISQTIESIEWLISHHNLEIIQKKEMEGIVPTYSAGPTYWHDYSFIVRYN